MDSTKQPHSIFRTVVVACIAIYQKTLSPDHGILRPLFGSGVCRFRPTCSEYTKESVRMYGMKGVFMGMRQLSRCHPFAK